MAHRATERGVAPLTGRPRAPRRWWQPRRSRRAQRRALALCIATLAALGWLARSVYENLAGYHKRPAATAINDVILEIPHGASFPAVLQLLTDHDIVPAEQALYFKVFVLHRGVADRITAGQHHFAGHMTPEEILQELLRPQPAQEVHVTIPEGKNMLEVVEILTAAGLSGHAAFAAALWDLDLLRGVGIPADSVEGYLFPDTYRFQVDASPREILTRMIERSRQVHADLRRKHRRDADRLLKQMGWRDHDVVILASIVEKETGAPRERPIIAGVFLNRLRLSQFQPKLLQTDPTIIYGCTVHRKRSVACRSFSDRIRRIHLEDPDNPYNTYVHPGLPPGPISNPGREALEAVLTPERTAYLYFVSRNDGTHEFNKTEAEHELAVNRYQRRGAVGPAPGH